METRMTIKFSDITGGGIPYGDTAGRPANPGVGKLYSNGQLQRLELYTGNQYGWQNIVAETPGVTGYTGTLKEITGGTVTITGTNFASGAIATLIGTDGTEYVATETVVTNLTQVVATFGPISGSKEPYDIRVTNPSNLYGVYYDILTVNDAPVWQTAAGSLGNFNEASSVSITLSATDEENNAVTYSSLNLPEWLSLNPSTGVLSGTAPQLANTTTYSFSVTATSDSNNISTRSFTITIDSVITWITPAGSLGAILDIDRTSFSTTVSANALGNTVSYSVTSGSLPSGLSLNSSTGVISGSTNSVGSATTYNFSITASDGTASSERSFSLTSQPPGSQSFSGSGSWTSSITGNIEVTLLGGGGGGSTGSGQWATGGGGGGYMKVRFPVVSGQSYNYSVGSAGPGQTACNNSDWYPSGNGGNSSFSTLIAYGGNAGNSFGASGGVNAPVSSGGATQTTGSHSVLAQHSGQDANRQTGDNNNWGGSNGLYAGTGIATYGTGASGQANHQPGTHAGGNGNGGAGGASCQTPHRGGGNGSAGIISLRW